MNVVGFWISYIFWLTPSNMVIKTSPPSHFSFQDELDETNAATIAAWIVPNKLIIAVKDSSAGYNRVTCPCIDYTTKSTIKQALVVLKLDHQFAEPFF